MTAYADLRTAIATALATVSNVGLVHNRERFVIDPAKYLDLFKTTIGGTVQVRAWLILRESVHSIPEEAFGESRQRHLFVLRAYQSFLDSADSYGTLQGLADDVMALFENKTTLGVTGVIVRMVGPTTMRSFEIAQFGSVLCHTCEIELPVDVMLPLGTA